MMMWLQCMCPVALTSAHLTNNITRAGHVYAQLGDTSTQVGRVEATHVAIQLQLFASVFSWLCMTADADADDDVLVRAG